MLILNREKLLYMHIIIMNYKTILYTLNTNVDML